MGNRLSRRRRSSTRSTAHPVAPLLSEVAPWVPPTQSVPNPIHQPSTFSMSHPGPTAQYLDYPVVSSSTTTTPTPDQRSSNLPSHSRAASGPKVPAQLPHNPSLHLAPSATTHPHYHQRSLSAFQYPTQNPQLYTDLPSHAKQPHTGAFPPGQLSNGQVVYENRIDQHSPHIQRPTAPQHPPIIPTVDSGAQLPPHVATGAPGIDLGQHSADQLRTSQQLFSGAHNFVMYNPVLSDNSNSVHVMLELRKETIPGAAFDSSARDPPPRCHPGTRLTIVNRAQWFIANCNGEKKMLWIVGPAGVGKSAIMQTIAETPFTESPNIVLGGSVFFSIKGRNDGSKAITTLAYQIAAKHIAYRQYVQTEVTNDPLLLSTSLAVQFNKFIVEPFIERFPNLHARRIRFFILIDGLDECEGHHTQCELLRLVSNFCITYPTSPLVWIIASRPEPQITSFFSRDEVIPAYEKQDVKVDSNEACEDVERFLRHGLKKVQMKSPALRDLPQWPTEREFLQLAYASKGLFVYASTVVKFVDDPSYGDPALQLEQVLEVIDTNPKWLVEGKSHPMALLDALYSRILSRVPVDVMIDTRKLLLLMIDDFWSSETLVYMVNWLGMTKNVVYGATYHLRSVLDVPEPNDAASRALECFHKSFADYLKDFERSGFCLDIDSAVQELNSSCARRILEEAPNATLGHGFGTTADISISWPCYGQQQDAHMRSRIYRYAAKLTIRGLTEDMPSFNSTFFIRALSSFAESSLDYWEHFRLLLFDVSRRSEFMQHNVLKQIPIRMLDSHNIPKDEFVDYRFVCPATAMTTDFDPWTSSCSHDREGSFREGQDQDWTSKFWLDRVCQCKGRFFRHFERMKTESPDDLAMVFIPLSLRGLVEYRFIDPDNDAAEWTYIIRYRFPSDTWI